MFGLKLDRDVVLASQLLHDLHKPWVFQWQADGTCRKEEPLAAKWRTPTSSASPKACGAACPLGCA